MINFLDVENSVEELKKKLRNEEIDEQAFEQSLLDLIDLAEDGYYWMLGHETGQWYRHDGQVWHPRDPGETFEPLKQPLPQEPPKTQVQWKDINIGWFIAGLIILISIAIIIFYSAV